MSLTTLLTYIAAVALLFTLIMVFGWRKHKSAIMTYAQNFCGVLFVFSGWVKAVDPMGTAFKMEQYFAEFQSTFSGTWMSFISPLFPLLSEYSIAFSVFMIVFEIILGIMLIMGDRPKLIAWAFFLLVAFFTVLTGFTYLTGYVPNGVNFFDFGQWADYKKSNMKVTDCGCFGDFIKLDPKVSFFKDVFLLIPAIYFLFKHKTMHQLFSQKARTSIVGISLVGLLVYCISNFIWNEPHIDFRPFYNGAEVAKIKAAEDEANAAVQITHFVMKNKETGKISNVPYAEYMKNFANYPKDKYETIDQLLTQPTIAKTKISEFQIEDFEGGDVNDVYLNNKKYHFMIMSPKLKYTTASANKEVIDTVTVQDTIFAANGGIDSIITKTSTVKSVVESSDFIWPSNLLSELADIKKFADAAVADGHEVSYVIGGLGKAAAEDLKAEVGLPATMYTADDILLKTIMRSNPGIVLWKDGKIIQKWHKRHLPTYEGVKANFLK